MPIEDLSGRRFGRWTAISGYVQGKTTFWTCRCDCGVEKGVAAYSLKCGDSKSCGCLNKENRHFNTRTHGMSKTPTYIVWTSMIARCSRKNADPLCLYLARGIDVCDRWRNSFEAFLADMGERPSDIHSIDRIDVNRDYCPENCRWATPKEQARNRRSNKTYTHDGQTMTLPEWAEKHGMAMRTLWARLNKGIPFHVAISTPVRLGQKGIPRS